METVASAPKASEPWNKGKLVGQKTPFKLKEIWAIRVRLQIARRCRDLALFNLAVDSKLRACDLMKLRVRDVCHGQTMATRALVLQQKTSRPVQFEITGPTRESVLAWIAYSRLKSEVTFSFQAESMPRRIYPLANTLGSLIHGSCNWDWIRPATALTR